MRLVLAMPLALIPKYNRNEQLDELLQQYVPTDETLKHVHTVAFEGDHAANSGKMLRKPERICSRHLT